MLKKRELLLSILLVFVTCGIYQYIWLASLSNDMSDCLGEERNGGMEVFLIIITCGIYLFYWNYKQGKRIANIQEKVGIRYSDNSVIYLVISFFGLSAIPLWIMQSNMNEVIDKLNYTHDA